MDGLAQGDHFDGKDSSSQDKGNNEGRDGRLAYNFFRRFADG